MTDAPRRRVSLPYTDARHQRAHHFLVEEAALLDDHDFDGWLGLLTDDVRYRMPVQVTTVQAGAGGRGPLMHHFDEDRYSLEKRVARLHTGHAWTEDPPSRIRHFVTNVRTFAGDDDGQGGLEVESAVLLFRSRGDTRAPEIVSARRADRLREIDGSLRLARRDVEVDEAVLRTQNLAIFL